MRNGREIVGLPVVAIADGATVGIVRDLVIDPTRRAVGSLVVGRGRHEPHGEVPFEAVRSIGPDAVTIERESDVVPVVDWGGRRRLLEGEQRLLGVQVLTDGGRVMGKVSDVVVDERDGRIVSYKVSAGTIRDLISGALTVPSSAPRAVGIQFMVIPESIAMGREKQISEGPPLVVEAPPEAVGPPPQAEVERVAADEVVRLEDLIVGMRARRSVVNEEPGGVICYEGEPITRETVEKAKGAAKLNLLVEAAGEGLAAAISGGLSEQYARVAVGRMAGRTVTTPDGEVVVAQGDVVTRQSVARAREAGVLDQLAEAVREGESELPGAEAEGLAAARIVWKRAGRGFGPVDRGL